MAVVVMCMSYGVTIKVHNVFHNQEDYNVSEAERYIEEWFPNSNVDVRIATGDTNSPLFVTINRSSVSIQKAKRIARSAVQAFSKKVDGIDVENTIQDSNIKIKNT